MQLVKPKRLASLRTRGEISHIRACACAAYGVYGRMPGDFQFDPLNFYRPLSDEGKVGAQERELANGRLAMLAIASYVGTEWVYHEPVVSATPALFQPIIFSPVFRAFMDASFGMASTAPN